MTDRQYIEGMLLTKRYELEECHVKHRIHMSTHEMEKKMLYEHIHSLEKQLGDNKE